MDSIEQLKLDLAKADAKISELEKTPVVMIYLYIYLTLPQSHLY